MSGKRSLSFRGKVLVVYCDHRDPYHPLVLQSPYLEDQAGRSFLVGKVPRGATENDWAAGRLYAVAWEKVSHYVLFDSLKDYRDGGKRKAKAKRGRPGRSKKR